MDRINLQESHICLVLMSRRERMLCVEMPALARLGTAYRSGAEVLRWRTMQRRGGGHSVLRRARKYFFVFLFFVDFVSLQQLTSVLMW